MVYYQHFLPLPSNFEFEIKNAEVDVSSSDYLNFLNEYIHTIRNEYWAKDYYRVSFLLYIL